MILTELAGRNLSVAHRELLNTAVILEYRQIKLKKHKGEHWYDEELKKHDAARKKVASLVAEIESVKSLVTQLEEFDGI